MKIKLIGQSTFQIKVKNILPTPSSQHQTKRGSSRDEIVILTDPWFGLHFLRAVPLKTKLEEIENCDLMLVSHNHIDHFDNIAINLAKKFDSIIIGSRKVVRRAEKKGAKKVVCLNYKNSHYRLLPCYDISKMISQESLNLSASNEKEKFYFMQPGKIEKRKFKCLPCVEFLGLKIVALYAEHPFASDAISFLVDVPSGSEPSNRTGEICNSTKKLKDSKKIRIYFSGDTRFSKRLVDELQSVSNEKQIDVAFLQIACSVYFFKKDGLDLLDAVKLTKEIKPKIAIPMHYQVKMKTRNPEEFKNLAENSDTKVVIIPQGEEVIV